MTLPKTLSQHDVKLAILRAMDDGRERLATEIAARLNPRLGLTTPQVARHLRELARVNLVKIENLPTASQTKAYRKTATGKCPGCGRDVSFLAPGSVYRCPTCAK